MKKFAPLKVLISFALLLSLAGIAVLYLTPNGFFGRSSGHYFTNGPNQIFFTDEGQGEVIVLLHGFAVNGDLNWKISGVRDELKKRYRLITVDLRGHGLSSKPHQASDYGIEMAKDISELLKHLSIPKAIIAGYSLGGFVTLKFASLFPEQTQKALVMGAGWEEAGNESVLQRLQPAAQALKENKAIPPLSKFLNPNKEPGLFHEVWVLVLTKLFNDPLALAALIEGTEGLTLTKEELQAVKTPLCVIVGSEDPFAPAAEKIKEVNNKARLLIIKGMNHMTAVSSDEFIPNIEKCISN